MLITHNTRWCSRPNCNNLLTYNNGHWPDDSDDNSLDIAIRGGYGGFIDTTIDLITNSRTLPAPPKPEVTGDGTCLTCAHQFLTTICHECAHELMEWLGIPKETVARWHSHRTTYHHDNPDHFGWDYQH